MALHVWFIFSVAYLITTLSPGPNVLLVIRNTLRYGARGTLATLAGNLAAQLFLIVLVALGVGALVAAMPMAFLAMKLIGAAYLIYIGLVQLLRRQGLSSTAMQASLPRVSSPKVFGEALLVSISNPKTLIFFSAFLPQFIEPGRSLFTQFTVMYLTIALIVVTVHCMYSLSLSRLSKQLSASRWVVAIKRASGALFIGLGVKLLMARQA
jgi:threonine/homoserine/homoserine lactone efflux protein